MLAYDDKAGGTEENALYGTPDEICTMIDALRGAGRRLCAAHHARWRRATAPVRPRHHCRSSPDLLPAADAAE